MLPPELHDEDLARNLVLPNEPPLWPAVAADGYQRRSRLSLFPPRAQQVAIRIDTNSSGETIGHVTLVKWQPKGRLHITQDRTFPVSSADVVALNNLIAESKLWQIYPEYWVNTPSGTVCIDGVEMIMERVEQRQYRFSEANAQCTAPLALLRVAAKMIDLAGLGTSNVAGWLH
jgi:hypothetical protein